MRLSVSNIAWELPEEEAAVELLRAEGISRVDVAPGKYFPDPANATTDDMARVRGWWQERGFTIEGMQALLFGTSGLNLFADEQGVMLERLAAVCRIGGGLGARVLTFGSPRQRDRSAIADDGRVMEMAVSFFRQLGDRAADAGVILCLEPNAAIYGCNFMVGTLETLDVVRHVDHSAVRLQLDVGSLILNGEDAASTIIAAAAGIGHIHASEPHLRPLGETPAVHAAAGATLRQICPEATVTIEMSPAKDEPHLVAVKRAIAATKLAYGDAA